MNLRYAALAVLLPLLPFSGQAQDAAAPAAAAASATPARGPGIREIADLPYVSEGTEKQRLDLYLPMESGTSPRPLVVYIHGGGWQSGSKKSSPSRRLVPLGYVAASVEYRFSQDAIFPAQIQDCKAAIRWLRAHAGEYGIDPKRIGVWGASAGGHLVALLGTTGDIRDFDTGENLDQSSAVQCVVDFFGPTDFLHYGDKPDPRLDKPDSPAAKLLGGLVSTHQKEARQASAIYYVTPQAAPFLILHGDRDPMVPIQQSVILNAALQKAGVESRLQIVPGAGHGGRGFDSPDNVKLIASFLAQHLGPADTKPKPGK